LSVAVLPAGVDEQRLIVVVEHDDATRAFLLDNPCRRLSRRREAR
jgi:hypothetical protein